MTDNYNIVQVIKNRSIVGNFIKTTYPGLDTGYVVLMKKLEVVICQPLYKTTCLILWLTYDFF